MSKYSEKLKDPRWQKKRLEILDRDNWTCRICEETEKTLHVHHLHYSSGDPWGTDNRHLITLCENCHDVEHDNFSQAIESLKVAFASLSLNSADIMELAYSFNDYANNIDHFKEENDRLFASNLADMVRDFDSAHKAYSDFVQDEIDEWSIRRYAPGRVIRTTVVKGIEHFGSIGKVLHGAI